MSTPVSEPLASGAEPPRPVCRSCGRTASVDDESPALTWSLAVEGGRTSWSCPGCARHSVRSIESTLDDEWW